MAAITALEGAQRSWAGFAAADLARRRVAKRAGHKRDASDPWVTWREGYLTGACAEAWYLGICDDCDTTYPHTPAIRPALPVAPSISTVAPGVKLICRRNTIHEDITGFVAAAIATGAMNGRQGNVAV